MQPFLPGPSSPFSHIGVELEPIRLFVNLDCYCLGTGEVSEVSTSLDWLSGQRKRRWALEDWIPTWWYSLSSY